MSNARTLRSNFINKLVPLPSGGSGYDAEKDKRFGAATIIGVNKSRSRKFRESLKLSLTEASPKQFAQILVHEKLRQG